MFTMDLARFIPLQEDLRYTARVIQRDQKTPTSQPPFQVLTRASTTDRFIKADAKQPTGTPHDSGSPFLPPIYLPEKKSGSRFQGTVDTSPASSTMIRTQTRWVT
jgi:hypothetical protein